MASPDAPSPASRSDDKEIIVNARNRPTAADPLATVNVVSFEAIQTVDKAIIGPVARSYKRTLPKPVQSGVHNFINNLNEPIVFVNFLLQLKPGQAATTVVRFAVNSTIGVAGLMDVASKRPLNLPRRSNGLADTLGYYHVKPGPYLFLPLIGSTTVRDMIGRTIDLMLLPATIGSPFNQPSYHLASGSVSALDERSHLDDDLRKIQESDNPYASMRDYYLKRREAEINALRGKNPEVQDAK
jgi:phospholipid-binding lipoprotein MlaA